MKAIFMGTPTFAINSLEILISKGFDVQMIITQPDKKQGRKMKFQMPPVKKKALEMGLKVYQPEKINSNEAIDIINILEPDIIVVTAYGKILPKAILDIPKFGCINVHASLLPNYRGSSPINTAILNGDKITGITTMFMQEKLDSGDIILQDEIEIKQEDNAVTLTEKLAKLSEKTLGNTLNMINMNIPLPSTPQEEDRATFCKLLTKEMGHINYNNSAEEIINLIRALQPWPGTYSIYKDQKFKIIEAQKLDNKSDFKPGTIVNLEKTLIITTATNDIRIKKLQFPGKNIMETEDYLRGNKLELGYELQ